MEVQEKVFQTARDLAIPANEKYSLKACGRHNRDQRDQKQLSNTQGIIFFDSNLR